MEKINGILITPTHAQKGLNRSLSVTYELQEGEDALVACATFVTVGVGLRDVEKYRRVRYKLSNTIRQRL